MIMMRFIFIGIQSMQCQSPRLLCNADSGTEKKRQKLHFEPDEKVGSSTLQLVVKNEDDHVLTLESTLETTGKATCYFFL